MPTLEGPCLGCGQHTKRYRRPGKELLCLDCAIAKMCAYMRTMHDGTSPQLAHSIASGRAAGDQIRARSGPIYERWQAGCRAGMARWLAESTPDPNAPIGDEMRWTPEGERPAP